MIAIIDYGLGNVKAFANAYKRLDIPCTLARHPDDLKNVSKIILPGVGSFGHAMSLLNGSGLRELLDEKVLDEQIPVLGVCVGMQILANSSEEGDSEGLGWIKGHVKKFRPANEQKYLFPLPHMGWNNI